MLTREHSAGLLPYVERTPVVSRHLLLAVCAGGVVSLAISCGGQANGPGGSASGATGDHSPIAAMLSVHAATRWRDLGHGLATAEPGFIGLDEAVRILASDTSPLGWSRRRRAIAALMAAGWNDDEFDSVVERLGGRPAEIRSALRRGSEALPFHDDGVESIERAVSGLEDTVVFAPQLTPAKQCWKAELGNYVGWANDSNTIIIGSAVSIDPKSQSFKEVKESLDPQSWDDCSGFWPKDGTYLVERTAPPWLDEGEQTPKPLAKPPAPGSLWSTPLFLFEAFDCTDGCDAHFKNVLVTLVEERLGRHVVIYQLASRGALSGDIYGNEVRPIIDQGSVETWEDGSGVIRVTGRKEVEFDDYSANVTAYAALLEYEKERGLGELACCETR